MAGNYPIYSPGCEIDPKLKVEQYITSCDDVTLRWEGFPEHCDTIPQGYHVYRTTTPPTSSAESLCIGIDDKKVLRDGSIYNHTIRYYKNGTQSYPTYTSMTPRGTQSNRNGITLDRSNNEYLDVVYSNQFNFRHSDFTIELWVGNLQEPWQYHFPCQTIIASYNANNNRALWRLFFEPTAATLSVTDKLSAYSSDTSTTGNLVLEFNEFGDGTGQTISEVIMPVTSNTNPAYSWSGNALRYGYAHVAVVREDTSLKVFVDGVNKKTIALPFEPGGDSVTASYPSQNITIGRHYGDSGRLDPHQFATYQPTGEFGFADGDRSCLHGQVYDIRIVKGIALIPPVGGQVDGLCNENAWHQSFTKVAGLPHTTKQWTDPSPPVDKGAYYRVTAVQCGKDVSCVCPNYVLSLKESEQKINAIAVNTDTELTDALNEEPPTMLDVFNTWDRGNPIDRSFYPGGTTAAGDHAAWYFDNSLGSFVNPVNTSDYVHIIAPQGQWMKRYKHEAIVQSYDEDDDKLSLIGAFALYNGQRYSINFCRTQGGFNGWDSGYSGNWHAVLCGPGFRTVLGNKTIGGYSWNQTGGDGWNGKTAFIKIERNGNILRAWTGAHRGSGNITRDSHEIDLNSEFQINFALDAPPAGMANWLPFQGMTGYGFSAWSQGDAFYRDWYLHPNPTKRIFDFTDGAPGKVYDWNMLTGKWELVTASAWQIVGQTATAITFPDTGKTYRFDCSGSLTVT